MSDVKKELYQKLKTLSYEDLLTYERSGVFMNSVIRAIGVAILLAAMFYPGFIMIVACTVAVIFLSQVSIGIDETLDMVRENLEKKTPGHK